MPSLQDIRRRIGSVRSTQKITRAMKMVAAAKLRRAQDAMLQARPYAHRMREVVNRLSKRADRQLHPLLRMGSGNRVEIVVVTADRGLCGGFNTNIVNTAMRHVRETFKDRDVVLTLVGRKGVDVLSRRRRLTVRETYTEVYGVHSLRTAETVAQGIVESFSSGETAEVYCLYNEFKSAIAQKVTLERMLPFETNTEGDYPADYTYEPEEADILNALLGQYLQIQLHRILLESSAAEQGARMAAMDAATKNAGDVIGRLTLYYNRVRQDNITREMIEIVSGTEAL